MVASGVSDSLLALYDIKNERVIDKAGVLDLDTQGNYAMSVSGRLYKYSENTVLYLPRHDYRIFEYVVENGTLKRGRIFETMPDTFTFKPSTDQSSEGRTMIQAPSVKHTLKSDMTRFGSGYLTSFHLAGSHPTQRFVSYLDVLDRDLNYQYSLGDFYPKSLGDFAVYDDTLCILFGDNTITCYEIPEAFQ